MNASAIVNGVLFQVDLDTDTVNPEEAYWQDWDEYMAWHYEQDEERKATWPPVLPENREPLPDALGAALSGLWRDEILEAARAGIQEVA